MPCCQLHTPPSPHLTLSKWSRQLNLYLHVYTGKLAVITSYAFTGSSSSSFMLWLLYYYYALSVCLYATRPLHLLSKGRGCGVLNMRKDLIVCCSRSGETGTDDCWLLRTEKRPSIPSHPGVEPWSLDLQSSTLANQPMFLSVETWKDKTRGWWSWINVQS